MTTDISIDATNGNKLANIKRSIKVEVTKDKIEVISAVTYSQIFDSKQPCELKMTIFIPLTNTPKPTILHYPGGGFTSANYNILLDLRMALAKAGFVVASAEYRTVPHRYPALIEDAKTAIRFLRAHAEEFSIDQERIGVIGDSAGGYVAQMVGATIGERQFDKGENLGYSSCVKTVVSMYGISNLLNIAAGFAPEIQAIHSSPAVTEALLVNGVAFDTNKGGSIQSDPQKALDASPMGHIKDNMPPYLLMHGNKDHLVSEIQSEQMFVALTDAGNKAEFIVVDGADHADIHWAQSSIFDIIIEWFNKYLK